MDIRETVTDEPLSWGEVFFMLHKHCHLSKWQIWEYTLPQVAELLNSANKHIQFEIEIMTAPMRMFGGGGGLTKEVGSTSTPSSNTTEDGYEVITEEGLGMLGKALGGG